jgi:hypothetical protein
MPRPPKKVAVITQRKIIPPVPGRENIFTRPGGDCYALQYAVIVPI